MTSPPGVPGLPARWDAKRHRRSKHARGIVRNSRQLLGVSEHPHAQVVRRPDARVYAVRAIIRDCTAPLRRAPGFFCGVGPSRLGSLRGEPASLRREESPNLGPSSITGLKLKCWFGPNLLMALPCETEARVPAKQRYAIGPCGHSGPPEQTLALQGRIAASILGSSTRPPRITFAISW